MEDKKQITLAEAMKLMGIDEIAEFKPTARVIPGLDLLLYLEKNTAFTARHVPGSNVALLYSNTFPEEFVGIEIWGFSQVFEPPEPLPRDTERFRRLAPEPTLQDILPPDFSAPLEVKTTAMLRKEYGAGGHDVI